MDSGLQSLCECGHSLADHDRDTPRGPCCGVCVSAPCSRRRPRFGHRGTDDGSGYLVVGQTHIYWQADYEDPDVWKAER